MSKPNPLFDDSNLPGGTSSSTSPAPRNLARENEAHAALLDDDNSQEDKENKETQKTAARKRELDIEEPAPAAPRSWFMQLSAEHQALLRAALPEGQEWDMNTDINASFSVPLSTYGAGPGGGGAPGLTINNHTPLTFATSENLYSLVETLLALGANPNVSTIEHYKPLDFLCWDSGVETTSCDKQAMAELLVKYGANYLQIHTNCYAKRYEVFVHVPYARFLFHLNKFLIADDWLANKIRAQIYRVSLGPVTNLERKPILDANIPINTNLLNLIVEYSRPTIEELLRSTLVFDHTEGHVRTAMSSGRRPIYMARIAQSYRAEEEAKRVAELSATLPNRLAAAEKQIAHLSKENARLSQALAAATPAAALSFSASASPASSATPATAEEIERVAKAHAKGTAEWQV